jgi:hypothetical protein
LEICARERNVMSPDTRKTQVRGPEASMHARRLPVPESFKVVTSITAPPRPPAAAAPPPCAPGNAGQSDPLHVTFEDGLGVGVGAGVGVGVGVGVGAVTVTLADADLFDWARLVAVTVSVPAFAGAVYSPDELIVPRAAVHVTVSSVAVPDIVAEKCSVPPVVVEEELGVIVTEVTAEPPFGGTLVGFVAEADPAHPDIQNEKLKTKAKIALKNTHLKRLFSDTRIM